MMCGCHFNNSTFPLRKKRKKKTKPKLIQFSFLLWRHIIYLCLVWQWHTVNSTLFNLPLSFVDVEERNSKYSHINVDSFDHSHVIHVTNWLEYKKFCRIWILLRFTILSRSFHSFDCARSIIWNYLFLFFCFQSNWNSWVSVTSIVFD